MLSPWVCLDASFTFGSGPEVQQQSMCPCTHRAESMRACLHRIWEEIEFNGDVKYRTIILVCHLLTCDLPSLSLPSSIFYACSSPIHLDPCHYLSPFPQVFHSKAFTFLQFPQNTP